MSGQKITPMLWFDGEAEAAAKHYTAAFKDGRITHVERYGTAGPGPKGSVMLVTFELAGQTFHALNGGPAFKPSGASSLLVACDDQAEIDRLWDHFSEGGATLDCGWLTDRWGYSWQIVPRRMMEIMAGDDADQKARAFGAMMQMQKFDLAKIETAARG